MLTENNFPRKYESKTGVRILKRLLVGDSSPRREDNRRRKQMERLNQLKLKELVKRREELEKELAIISEVYDRKKVEVAKVILNSTIFSEVASYWSGMPANTEYCGADEFMKVYDRALEIVGQDAAYSFANMIIDMPTLAPSNVIRAVISLAENDWLYDPQFSERISAERDPRPVRVDQARSEHDFYAEKVFGNLTMTTNIDDETEVIREGFELALGDELTKILASRESIEASPEVIEFSAK